ncbi:MAG: GNAT family N-acetyltransferase [Saprospiraceae bacterium]|nr:GNAT family N-acetyltransferase [Saprospiraceae bacterium]MBK6478188.1 GNAT family N-acetyltransferase [Saprospiraceae bacterium]MBK6817658.1 GNAT family N-acetyltransferase [Saprospiraceae bacterium]MBK7606162.1 GNAT family N-acetyltransferase [Saprospiraceae bacterium]MBK8779172.1 GNAT family N-acetyltransferase [Saprospiraceae bacterium]
MEAYPPTPIILTGQYVTLEPLNQTHAEGLEAAASDGKLWNLWFTSVPRPEKVHEFIETALAEQLAGKSIPFVVRRSEDEAIVGSTRYMNIEQVVRRLEIGHTWYAASAQRTPINTECKLLLLRHAFESLDCVAVEFRTHRFNEASRRAILRLGAVQDGILRNHRIGADGTLRDTVVFSILQSEWPAVKMNLNFKLSQYLER